MTLRAAIQMDSWESIHPKTDTTFLLMLEAAARGYELWVYTPDKISWRDGRVMARADCVTLRGAGSHSVKKSAMLDLQTADVVLVRQNPPFDMSYISATYLLEKLHPKPLVVNHPTALRDHPEKLFPAEFQWLMPPTLISADILQIRDFYKEHKDVVIKPLYGYSGKEVFRLKPGDDNVSALLETLFAHSNEPRVVQPYLKEMKTGERRIVMIDGEMAAIAGRIPPKGETRASIPLGATYVKAKPTRRHRDICEALRPWLKQEGILLAGVDVIGDWLTEINITSPGSLVPLNKLYGLRLERTFWDAVESYIS